MWNVNGWNGWFATTRVTILFNYFQKTKIFQNKVALLLWNSANNVLLKLFNVQLLFKLRISVTRLLTITCSKRNITSRSRYAGFIATIMITLHKRRELVWAFCQWAPTAQIWRAYVRGITMYTYIFLCQTYLLALTILHLFAPHYIHIHIPWYATRNEIKLRVNFIILNALRSFYCCGFLFVGENYNNNNLMD